MGGLLRASASKFVPTPIHPHRPHAIPSTMLPALASLTKGVAPCDSPARPFPPPPQCAGVLLHVRHLSAHCCCPWCVSLLYSTAFGWVSFPAPAFLFASGKVKSQLGPDLSSIICLPQIRSRQAPTAEASDSCSSVQAGEDGCREEEAEEG
jgi:hypothetical protein